MRRSLRHLAGRSPNSVIQAGKHFFGSNLLGDDRSGTVRIVSPSAVPSSSTAPARRGSARRPRRGPRASHYASPARPHAPLRSGRWSRPGHGAQAGTRLLPSDRSFELRRLRTPSGQAAHGSFPGRSRSYAMAPAHERDVRYRRDDGVRNHPPARRNVMRVSSDGTPRRSAKPGHSAVPLFT